MVDRIYFLCYNTHMENLNFIIGKNLTYLRKYNKMTQLELAEKLNYSDKAISKWENGESVPSVEVLYKLSKIYNVSLDSLVGEKPTNEPAVITQTHKKKRFIITMLSVLAVWFVAVLFYIAFDIFSDINLWILFCWSVPATMIVSIVFDAVWNKHRLLFWLVTGLIWSILLCTSLQFFNYNVWQILFIGIPLQIGTILWAKLLK